MAARIHHYPERGPRIAGAHGAEIWRVVRETVTRFGEPSSPGADLDIDTIAEGLTRDQAQRLADQLNEEEAPEAGFVAWAGMAFATGGTEDQALEALLPALGYPGRGEYEEDCRRFGRRPVKTAPATPERMRRFEEGGIPAGPSAGGSGGPEPGGF